MAWVKVPPENHPVFRAALPKDPRVTTINMFGGVAAMVNGNIFGGLFARSTIVRLSESDQQAALALDGAGRFDPMGNGRTMNHTVLLPESVMDEPPELQSWLRRALDFAQTLPKKEKKAPKAAAASKPAATPSRSSAAPKSAPQKSAAQESAAPKSARRSSAPKKLAGKPPAAKKLAAKKSAAKKAPSKSAKKKRSARR